MPNVSALLHRIVIVWHRLFLPEQLQITKTYKELPATRISRGFFLSVIKVLANTPSIQQDNAHLAIALSNIHA